MYTSIIRMACISLLAFTCAACRDFLDLKPDQHMKVPVTLADCRALLDDYTSMNTGYPSLGEGASDNLFLKDEDWKAISYQEDRDIYAWNPEGYPLVAHWLNPSKVIFNANLVLQVLNGINPAEEGANTAKGEALFFRAYAFFELTLHFAPPYRQGTAAAEPGIPLRLNADLESPSVRASLADTYSRILQDLHNALPLLPPRASLAALPGQDAVYALLARVYLSMGDYPSAESNASQSLQLTDSLIDFNQLSGSSTSPIPRFNPEVIFQSVAHGSSFMATSIRRVDTTLYDSYREGDLRKSIFYRLNSDSYATFKGSYDGTFNSSLFNGLSTPELYLTLAECKARAGDVPGALEYLNVLLTSRWSHEFPFEPLTATNADHALRLTLKERRKELAFRGLRWMDLRRLNEDPTLAITLSRHLNGQLLSLPPGDLRYTFLLPYEVISNSNLIQNER